MKKTFLLFFTLCVAQTGFAQLKVDASGNTLFNGNIYIGGTSKSLATSGNTPLVFKVNNSVKAGSTGASENTNVSFGYGSLSNLTGADNTANGYYALRLNTTGSSNTASGSLALCSNTTGSNNTANGYVALRLNTTGINNTANGAEALYSNKTGNGNTANGYNALYSNTASYNTADGYYALRENTTGNENTANGAYALYANTTGYINTAIGAHALRENTTGNENSAIGFAALHANTNGFYNTAIGRSALRLNTTGYRNTAIGYYTLYSNTTGYNNTAIGAEAHVSANNLINATAIGNGAKATASNQVRIGNSSVTSIGGYTAWTNISDGRAKKNIRTDVPGLNFINSLQPVTYNLDLDAIDKLLQPNDPEINRLSDSLRAARSSEEKEFEAKSRAAKQKRVQTGFVAQDVEKIAKSIGYDFSGVDVDEKGIYGLRYAEFVVPLVKAVQELSEALKDQRSENEKQQIQIEEQREQIKQLVKLMGIKSIDKKTFEENGIESIPLLLQNTPNPFNQTTEIGYFIPETAGSANIYIYDVNGVQQRNISIAERGNGVTVLQATALQAGIYFYTLICDGKPVDTKQMILTK